MRPAPDGYCHCRSVEQVAFIIMNHERDDDVNLLAYISGEISFVEYREVRNKIAITEIACDNDLGEDYLEGYKLLDWLETTGRNYPIRILTDNPVARERMRTIIQRNHWEEIVC